MDLLQGEPDSCNDTRVTNTLDGNEVASIEAERVTHIAEEEDHEPMTIPAIKSEPNNGMDVLEGAKMVDDVGTTNVSLSLLSPIQDTISEYNCVKCSAYESQRNQTLEELESARKIIDILQKEQDTNVPSNSECENSCVSRQETLKQASSTEWIIVPAKYTKYTSTKTSRSNLNISPTTNQQLKTWNRYTPLHNLQDSDAVLNDLQSHRKQRNQTSN